MQVNIDILNISMINIKLDASFPEPIILKRWWKRSGEENILLFFCKVFHHYELVNSFLQDFIIFLIFENQDSIIIRNCIRQQRPYFFLGDSQICCFKNLMDNWFFWSINPNLLKLKWHKSRAFSLMLFVFFKILIMIFKALKRPVKLLTYCKFQRIPNMWK